MNFGVSDVNKSSLTVYIKNNYLDTFERRILVFIKCGTYSNKQPRGRGDCYSGTFLTKYTWEPLSNSLLKVSIRSVGTRPTPSNEKENRRQNRQKVVTGSIPRGGLSQQVSRISLSLKVDRSVDN